MKKYLNNPTVKNFQKLLFGNLSIQIVNFAFYPLITRIYSPSEMGEFGAMMSVVQILAVFTTGQYYVAMVGEKDEQKIDDIVSASLFLNGCFFILLLMAYFFMDEPIWIPVIVLFYNVSEVLKLRSYRVGKIHQANLSTFLNRTASQLFKLIGHFHKTNSLLLISEAVGNLLGMGNYLRDKIDFSFSRISKTLKTYSKYPVYYLPNSLCNIIFQEIPTLFFAVKFSPALAGHYFLYQKAVGQPLTLVGNLIASASIKISADKQTEKESRAYLRGIALKIFLMFLPVSLFLFFAGEKIFTMFMGQNYREAGVMASFLFFIVPFKALKGMSVISTLSSANLRIFSGIKLLSLGCVAFYMYFFQGRDFNNFLIFYSLIEITFDAWVLRLSLKDI